MIDIPTKQATVPRGLSGNDFSLVLFYRKKILKLFNKNMSVEYINKRKKGKNKNERRESEMRKEGRKKEGRKK